MKAHIGVDAESGLVHTVVGTAANVADITQTVAVLHGEERTVHLDAGYTGVEKREELQDRDIDWQVPKKPGKLKAIAREQGRTTAASPGIREGEHPFYIVKNPFGHRKVRYRGLVKNIAQLHILFALANLVIAKRRLLALDSQGAS
jgi:IS5 family transposase